MSQTLASRRGKTQKSGRPPCFSLLGRCAVQFLINECSPLKDVLQENINVFTWVFYDNRELKMRKNTASGCRPRPESFSQRFGMFPQCRVFLEKEMGISLRARIFP